MGNTQCGFLNSSSNTNHEYQYISEEIHPIYGEIRHVKNIKTQEHVAITKYSFKSEKQYEKYEKFVNNFIKLPKSMPYVQIIKTQEINQQNKNSHKKQEVDIKYKCGNNNIFKAPSEQNQFSCITPQINYHYTVHIEYFPYKNFCLEYIIQQKNNELRQFFQSNKIAKNMQFDLFQKLKLNEYSKIDQLPPKQRKFINEFYTQIQILRILDSLVSGIFGSKIFNLNQNGKDLGIRPNLIFRKQQGKYVLLLNQVVQQKSNIHISIQNLKKLIKNQQNLGQQQQIITYIHPKLFPEIILQLLLNDQTNLLQQHEQKYKTSELMIEKQNIFALGLIMIQICLFQPNICSKIYQINNISKKYNKSNLQEIKRNSIIPSLSCYPKETQLSQSISIKLKQNVIHKYLSKIKIKYSESLVKLIEKMIFNWESQGYDKYENLITKITGMIKQNIQKLKDVYGTTKNSRADSLQKIGKFSKSGTVANMSPHLSSNSLTSVPTLSYASSYSMLPLQSHQPILSFQILKKYYQRIQNRAQNLLVKQQITLLSDFPLKNQQHFQSLIQKDQKRILNELNKIQTQQNTTKNRSERFSYRKIQNKALNQSVNKKNEFIRKNNEESREQQKRVNSMKKSKQQKLKKTYQQIMLGSVNCETLPEQSIERPIQYELQNQPIIYQSSKSDLKNLLKAKNSQKNNLIYKDSQMNKMNSENIYQVYMKEYQQLLEKQRQFY